MAAVPLHPGLAGGRSGSLAARPCDHGARRRRAPAGDRRLRARLRGRHDRVLHPERHRRARGGAHRVPLQKSAGGRGAHVGAPPAAVGDDRRARLRRPRRAHRRRWSGGGAPREPATTRRRAAARRRPVRSVTHRGARRRAAEAALPPPRRLRDRRRDPLRAHLLPALVAQVQGVHGCPLRPRQHGPGRVQHGARPLPRDHHRRPGAAADVPPRLARRSDPRAARAPLARVAQPRDAAGRAGRDRCHGRLAGVPARDARHAGPERRRLPRRRLPALSGARVPGAQRVPPGRPGDAAPPLGIPVHGRGPLGARGRLPRARGGVQGDRAAGDRLHGRVLRDPQALALAARRLGRRRRLVRGRGMGRDPALQRRPERVHRPLRGLRERRGGGGRERRRPSRPDRRRPLLRVQSALLARTAVAARIHVTAQPADAADRSARVRAQRALDDHLPAAHRVPLHGARDPLPLRGGGVRSRAPLALARRRLPQSGGPDEGRARAARDARPPRAALRALRQLLPRAAPLLAAGRRLRRPGLRQDVP